MACDTLLCKDVISDPSNKKAQLSAGTSKGRGVVCKSEEAYLRPRAQQSANKQQDKVKGCKSV